MKRCLLQSLILNDDEKRYTLLKDGLENDRNRIFAQNVDIIGLNDLAAVSALEKETKAERTTTNYKIIKTSAEKSCRDDYFHQSSKIGTGEDSRKVELLKESDGES